MQYEERYIVEHTRADGKVDVEQYDDGHQAYSIYQSLARMLDRGEKVQLHRYSTVVLASSVRAK